MPAGPTEKLTPYLHALAATSPTVARQFIASTDEESITDPLDRADPIGDAAHSPLPGLVHRYPDRVLLLPTMACAAHCRFCFRRDRVGGDLRMTEAETAAALAHIAARPDIHEAILSGGDPLTLPPPALSDLIARIDAIPSIEVLRIHTRLPIVAPKAAIKAAAALSGDSRAARWVAIHVNHPDELTAEARTAIRALQKAGCFLVSQTVLLKGINDDAAILAALFRALVATGVKPYYLHHLDRTAGTGHFRVPLKAGRTLVERLRAILSGLAQPTYVLDIPGGHGKVLACDTFVAPTANGDGWTVRDPGGSSHDYPDPAATGVARHNTKC